VPAASPLPRRIGGFGGADGLATYLASEGVAAVIDATHPFAARISAHAVAACTGLGVPLLAFSRAAWMPEPGDAWQNVPDIAAAVAALAARQAASVLLTTGRLDLAAFRGAPQHRYLVRTIDPPDAAAMPPGATLVLDRGPFTIAGERALMAQHGIALLVTKNSGGTASAPKLAAARHLGIPVLMVARPLIPARAETDRLDDVLAWIAHQAPAR
ncbi:cobalt-precorrin-6A reductase, partial [Lichenihabitans sp. Uapishka_5]|uniref:cobalt-precorrin-6A reductase n=1 Tax=Lichenihabitans sp. Uapishka_5 TaxID=3037302 RepID=UPI0029E808DC